MNDFHACLAGLAARTPIARSARACCACVAARRSKRALAQDAAMRHCAGACAGAGAGLHKHRRIRRVRNSCASWFARCLKACCQLFVGFLARTARTTECKNNAARQRCQAWTLCTNSNRVSSNPRPTPRPRRCRYNPAFWGLTCPTRQGQTTQPHKSQKATSARANPRRRRTGRHPSPSPSPRRRSPRRRLRLRLRLRPRLRLELRKHLRKRRGE